MNLTPKDNSGYKRGKLHREQAGRVTQKSEKEKGNVKVAMDPTVKSQRTVGIGGQANQLATDTGQGSKAMELPA